MAATGTASAPPADALATIGWLIFSLDLGGDTIAAVPLPPDFGATTGTAAFSTGGAAVVTMYRS